MSRIIKLNDEELQELKHRALMYRSMAGQFMTLQQPGEAERRFKEYHRELGAKYGYDCTKVDINPENGEVTEE